MIDHDVQSVHAETPKICRGFGSIKEDVLFSSYSPYLVHSLPQHVLELTFGSKLGCLYYVLGGIY